MDTIPPANQIVNTILHGESISNNSLMIIAAVTAISLFILFTFSFYEYALYSLSRNELSQIANSRSDEYKSLKKLLKPPKETLSSIVAGYYLSMIALVPLTCTLTSQVLRLTITPPSYYKPIEICATILILLLVGDHLPNICRRHKKLKMLYAFSGEMLLLTKMFFPIGHLLSKTNFIDKRLEVKSEHQISIDELNETLNTETVQNNEEKEILQGIVSFGSISVDEIMRPRVDIVDIDITSEYDKVLNTIKETEYSRLPVFEETIDNIKGILYIKDLLSHLNESKDFDWQKLIRTPYFVPETKKIDDLLKEFQSKHIHMAIVVDEFGGTAGIVTLEDILEVIVGDIVDEHDDEMKMYTKLDKRNFIIDAKIPLTDFYKIEKVNKNDFADIDTDADTLAGLMLEIKGDIPQIGDKIEVGKYMFQIVSADNRRIKKIKLQIPETSI